MSNSCESDIHDSEISDAETLGSEEDVSEEDNNDDQDSQGNLKEFVVSDANLVEDEPRKKKAPVKKLRKVCESVVCDIL